MPAEDTSIRAKAYTFILFLDEEKYVCVHKCDRVHVLRLENVPTYWLWKVKVAVVYLIICPSIYANHSLHYQQNHTVINIQISYHDAKVTIGIK